MSATPTSQDSTEPATPAKSAGRRSPELVTRIVSAVVMAAGALGALYAGSYAFAALIGLAALIVNWEWARLVRGRGSDSLAWLQAVGLLAVVAAMAAARPDLAFALLAAGLAASLAVAMIGGQRGEGLAWSLFGLVYMALPAMAMIWLRSDQAYGALALLFVFTVAWTSDTAAFAGGRLIGGPKLAPAVSPKKTWAGLISGVCAPAVLGYGFAMVVADATGLHLAVLAMALAFACQMGDLAESAIKRHFGTKDTSGLIPGHGGLLDRIDGLLIATLLAALLAFRDSAQPGLGLLLW